MIYLDNSATSFPKPKSVINAVDNAMRFYSANPGRSGHKMSMNTAQKVFECRQYVCNFFNVDDVSKVIFTSGCTHSLNTVIKGVLKKGDHCIISCLEHNSVTRPLEKLKESGVTCSVATVYPGDDDRTLESFRSLINSKTKLIVCTHASNVFGIRLPVERICALAHLYGILFCLDAAQTAGVFEIDVANVGYDFVCCAGHKGLYGPMGVGILIINTTKLPDTILEGGTGSNSLDLNQPDFTPDRYESGTLNIPGICGLQKGIEFVKSVGVEKIAQKEFKHIKRVHDTLASVKKVIFYNETLSPSFMAPVLSFSVTGYNSEQVASFLDKKFSIALRAGLHCAPLAHKFMNTLDNGTVRISPSYFTSDKDIDVLIYAIKNMIF